MEKTEKPSYAAAMEELEAIVARIQDDTCEIETIKELTTRALTLLKYCKETLFETDEELKKITAHLREIFVVGGGEKVYRPDL